MKPRLHTLWIVPVLLITLACQAGALLIEPTPTTDLLTVVKGLPPPASPTPLPSPTFTPSPTPTETPLPPTPTSTPTIIPTPSEQQLQVFEELWHVVQETYVYPDFNGLDWEAIGDKYRAQVLAGMSEDGFYTAMEEMIESLEDEHSVFLRPQEAVAEDAEFSGENDYVGIGVLTTVVEERERAVILIVFPGSPAEEAGLKSHDSILSVDGEQLVDEDGFRRNLLRGPENSSAVLTVQTPGEEPREVTVTRRRVTGAVPVPYSLLTTASGKRVGYILLVTFADETVDNQVEDALKNLTAEGPLDGLILDNRFNSGGADTVAKGVLGFFTKGTLGHFSNRDKSRRAFNVIGANINGSAQIPLVVLVGKGSVSFGEIFPGVLKDSGRAYIIGETTDGNIELLWGHDFTDGSRAWIAAETFRPINHPDDNWEETGIIPDIEALSEWDLVTVETDPAIEASLEYFDGLE